VSWSERDCAGFAKRRAERDVNSSCESVYRLKILASWLIAGVIINWALIGPKEFTQLFNTQDAITRMGFS
jgi:hypothetical protein